MEKWLEASISGSFKFKPEIDQMIDEFADHNVVVLEPTRGWLFVPSGKLIEVGFRPLPNERGLDIGRIEQRFLDAIRQSDFLYVNNQEHYLGPSSAFEIGAAHGMNKPIFIREALTLPQFEYDFASYYYWTDALTVATPAEAAAAVRQQKNAAVV
jgi:hypothetical protein